MGGDQITLKLFNGDGSFVRDIYRFQVDNMADKRGKGNVRIPFSNSLDFEVGEDRIFIREGSGTAILVLDPHGDEVTRLPLPFMRREVRDEDKDAWATWLRSLPGDRNWDVAYWRKTLPLPEVRQLPTVPRIARCLLERRVLRLWPAKMGLPRPQMSQGTQATSRGMGCLANHLKATWRGVSRPVQPCGGVFAGTPRGAEARNQGSGSKGRSSEISIYS